jgi:hypothetical protein
LNAYHHACLLNVCQQLNLMKRADSWNKTDVKLICSQFYLPLNSWTLKYLWAMKNRPSDHFLIILTEKSLSVTISWSKRKLFENWTISNVQFNFKICLQKVLLIYIYCCDICLFSFWFMGRLASLFL